MTTIHSRRAGALASLALLALLAGCGQREGGQTVGQRLDQLLGRTRQAANDVRQGGREAANDTRTSVMGAGGSDQKSQKDSGKSESLGMKIDDAGITAKVKTGLAADKDLSAGKIEVDTTEGVVTLKGDVANGAAKARATEIARNVKNVKSVINDLTVKTG